MDYVEEKGAVFVFQAVYLPMTPVDIPDRITNPLERMVYSRYQSATLRAEIDRKRDLFGVCNIVGLGNPLLFVDQFKIDGVVMHWLRSCRGTTIGQVYQKRLLEERSDLPVLFLESDMCDVRDYFEEDWKIKLNAFLETLEARKKGRG
jgi:hypothetical protein